MAQVWEVQPTLIPKTYVGALKTCMGISIFFHFGINSSCFLVFLLSFLCCNGVFLCVLLIVTT